MLAKIGTWLLTGLLAFAFVASGGMKLTAPPAAVEGFAKWGLPFWFLMFTGGIEVLGGLLLLWPKSAFWGAILLVAPTMFCAAALHLYHGDPIAMALPATVLLVMALGVAYLRRPAFLRGAAEGQG